MTPFLPGLTAAPFTPLLPNSELNLNVVPKMAELLMRNGVNGAFICGTTGEGYSLTSDERRRITEAWRAATPPGLKLIVHVGHLSLRESCALAKHAQDVRADAIATIAPSFFKPTDVHALVDWCREVAASAPRLPFYYYHMPAMTGITFTATEYLASAEGKIPSLAGVKFTYEDLTDYQSARSFAGGRYEILFGRDEKLLSGLELGATGAVGSTYNYAAPLFLRIIESLHSKDHEAARRDQANARAFIDVLDKFGGLPAGKAMMKLVGLDCGPVRLPLRSLNSDQEAALKAEMMAIGFFDYASAT